mgnify:CR=1 FL=1
MILDSEIKTKISPFAMREGEIKKFAGKDGFVSINQIISRVNNGQITDVHFKILELINKFEFMTSRQIYQMLKIDNVDIASQDKVNTRLDQMVKLKILTRYFFESEEGEGIFRIYCMEKMGKYILNSKEIECKWQPTDNIKPLEMLKRRLAGNQVIIAYLEKVGLTKSYEPKITLNAKMMGKKFKATGGTVKLVRNSKELDFLFEVVRREENWQEKLVDKMRLFKDFYDNFVPGDSGFPQKPLIIFVCEDEKHMAETFKTIVVNKVEIKDVPLYFTTDLKQISDKLGKSLVKFVYDEETKKYKVENPDIAILN